MIFKVYLMRRGGRRLSWRDMINGPAYVGDLSLGSVTSRNSVYKVAELFTSGGIATRLLPTLYEPVVIGIAPLAMQLRGFERMKEPEGYYSVIQEWHCEMP
jgi:hypothetical protein